MDGYGTEDQVAERIQELGHKRVAITDHGSIFGHVPYFRVMPRYGITPIFGSELYVVDDITVRDRFQATLGVNAIPHVTVLAANHVGYRNLVQLSKRSWVDGFHYKPRVDWRLLSEHQEGLVVLSGCAAGYPTRLLLSQVEGDSPELVPGTSITWSAYYRCRDFLAQRRNEIENFFVELVPEPGLDLCQRTSDCLVRLAGELQLPLVLTSDAHFPRAEDYVYQDILLCVGMGKKLRDESRQVKLPPYQYYDDYESMRARAVKVLPTTPIEVIDQALANTTTIAEGCNVELPKGKTVAFPGVAEDEKTGDRLLWHWIKEGLRERQELGLIPNYKEYYDRAIFEFNVLTRKKYADYILAVSDVIRWVKKQGGLVMVRGSAGGCLILWLVGASETDPIAHDLSFDRFYDSSRPDPPDVDIDFEHKWRDLAIDYMFEKYGQDHCAQVAALSRLTARAALQDTAKVLGIERKLFNRLSNSLDPKNDDVEAQYTAIQDKSVLQVLDDFPELRLYEGLIGQYRHSSIHAAGVLVSSIPISHVIGVILSQDKKLVATVDKHGAAELGLLKMDFLSVDALDVIAEAARAARGSVEWLYTLPLTDDKTFELARAGLLSSVFQLEGASAARVSREIKVSTFNDLVAASALCRPGPADWVATYQQNKTEPMAFQRFINSIHPKAANIVRKTWGIILYQEQVMKFAHDVAGLVMADVHKMRKAVTSSLGLEAWRDKFITGAQEHSAMSKQEAEFWWVAVATHGGYSFNQCLTGDTVLVRGGSGRYSGGEVTIRELYEAQEFYKGVTVLQLDDDGQIRPGKLKKVFHNGRAHVYAVKTVGNRIIRGTGNHRLLTNQGYLRIDELTTEHQLVCRGSKPTYEKPRKKRWSKGIPSVLDRVDYIDYVGEEDVYDIEMATEGHNFIANEIVSHNSHVTTYGIMSYWDLFLKTHYPKEFYEAAMNYASDYGRKRLAFEFRRRGGSIQLFNWQAPSDRFQVHENTLTGSVTAIKGVGPAAAKKLAGREFTSAEDFYKLLPKAVNQRLSRCASRGWDPCLLLRIADWFPVSTWFEADQSYVERYGLPRIEQIFNYHEQANFSVAGYVSYRSKKEDKPMAVLEDPSGAIMIKVAARKVRELGECFGQIEVGDFVGVNGWWSGDALYLSQITVLRREPLVEATV